MVKEAGLQTWGKKSCWEKSTYLHGQIKTRIRLHKNKKGRAKNRNGGALGAQLIHLTAQSRFDEEQTRHASIGGGREEAGVESIRSKKDKML